jgi:two-component system, OmpR family, copper resistance phosphate regulon response regulator CusR
MNKFEAKFMRPPRILVIEDEPKVASFIKKGLDEEDFEVEVAFDGNVGLKKATNDKFDLIILDVNLPYMNGYEICKSLRERNGEVPIIMLTALGTVNDKLEGFDSGADDYLVKPFEFKELLARVRALLKRGFSNLPAGNTLRIADLELNLDTKIVSRSDKKIDLTAKEFQLLEFLMKNKGRVISRAEIAEKVWDITFDTGTNIIDVYINFLRNKVDKKFSPKLIHTQVGMGYIMKEGE